MHPYIAQAIAEERAADAIRAAEASRRARDARQAVSVSKHQSDLARQPHQSYRARWAARRQSGTRGLTVSGQPCR